jgi:phage terminase large subunit
MTSAVTPVEGDLVHTYEPRGTALELFHCRLGEVLDSGPAGTGKSRACLEKLLMCALLTPGMRGLIARKTHTSLTSTTLVTWREHVAKEALAAGLCVYYGGSGSEPAQYRFTNGSTIALIGMDKPTKIMGSEFDMVYVGEATEMTPTDWEFFTVRLRNGRMSFQQLIADCNPDRPTHWLKTRTEDGAARILYSAHWENPRYFDEVEPGTPPIPATDDGEVPERRVEQHDGRWFRMTVRGAQYLAKLDKLTGVRRQRLRDGIWAAADGLVYDNWDPSVHIPPVAPKILDHWPRYWVVDFGFKNPFVAQWWAENDDGQLIRYREIYRTKRLVEDHARDMLRQVTRYMRGAKLTRDQVKVCKDDPVKGLDHGWLEWIEPKPQAIICDHDAEDRATLTKHLGMGTTPARKQVVRGIQAVEARLKVADNGRPGLILAGGVLVERDEELKEAGKPTCTEDEFGSYVWPDGKPGKSEDEHPVKEHDHGMDCVRYLVAHKDLRLRIRDREIGLEG